MKRLVKSNQNRIICGVCGGIGQYFGLDATLIRLAWVIFGFAGGSGVLAYILAAIIIPSE
ncbi:MAG: PspC domain-containing protein [Eubacterium sp.]|nr:PspC domain-containing protein [Eubacterium sp.]MCI8918741.1 PspC domain-containing protein [Eubacterium sp.]